MSTKETLWADADKEMRCEDYNLEVNLDRLIRLKIRAESFEEALELAEEEVMCILTDHFDDYMSIDTI